MTLESRSAAPLPEGASVLGRDSFAKTLRRSNVLPLPTDRASTLLWTPAAAVRGDGSVPSSPERTILHCSFPSWLRCRPQHRSTACRLAAPRKRVGAPMRRVESAARGALNELCSLGRAFGSGAP